ncbi:hypothetical protein KCU90_g215, partial [Aureobasidium melanogenum]
MLRCEWIENGLTFPPPLATSQASRTRSSFVVCRRHERELSYLFTMGTSLLVYNGNQLEKSRSEENTTVSIAPPRLIDSTPQCPHTDDSSDVIKSTLRIPVK